MHRMQSLAYIRRSARSRSDPGDLSRDFQIEKVRELASADAGNLRIIDGDWGKSAATDKTDRRLAFLAMLEEIERGEVSTIYAYAADRLARSVQWSARLLDLCRHAGTVIVTGEGRFEPDNEMTDSMFYFQAIQNENYSKQAKKKRDATVKKQREAAENGGRKLGPAFYGELPGEAEVLARMRELFAETGSANRTAWCLNEEGHRSRRGGVWTHGTVRNILIREGLMPRMGTRGAKPRAPFRLYRLLGCECGRTLSGVRNRGRVLYRCVNATSDPDHGAKSIAENRIMPAVRAELARLRPPDAVRLAADREKGRAKLEKRRRNVQDMYEMGDLEREEYRARIERIDGELDAIEAEAEVTLIPEIDIDGWTPENVNLALRKVWDRIELGRDMMPVRFISRLPEGWWS